MIENSIKLVSYERATSGISQLSLTWTFNLDLLVKLMTCQYLAYSIFHWLISSAVSLIALSPLFLSISFFVILSPSPSSSTDTSQLLISTAVCQTITEVNEKENRAETSHFSPAIPRLPGTFIILTWGRGPLGQWQMIMPTSRELRLIDVRVCVRTLMGSFIRSHCCSHLQGHWFMDNRFFYF